MADITIPTTAFVDVAQPTAGEPITKALVLNQGPQQGIVAPNLTPINTPAATIRNAIASDAAALTPGTTPAPLPDHFQFVDFTVNVSGATPGDVFKGSTPGVQFQFVDLTPDNIGITGKGPNLFMRTDSGDDLMVADGGRNIMSAGSGNNFFVNASGQDTALIDARTANASATMFNFKSGDDVAVLGLNANDFTFAIHETALGLSFDATAKVGGAAKTSAAINLPGYTTADFGSKLSLGLSQTTDGVSFVFVHAN